MFLDNIKAFSEGSRGKTVGGGGGEEGGAFYLESFVVFKAAVVFCLWRSEPPPPLPPPMEKMLPHYSLDCKLRRRSKYFLESLLA